MNMAYMTVLSPEEMISSEAVGLDFGERVLGSFAFLIPLGVACATFGCALSIQFGVTRLCYVASQEGQMLEPLSYVHMRRLTPTPAVAMQGILALVLILVGNIEELIELASFFIWFFYGSAVIALLTLRKTQPNIHRPYKVPLFVPIITLAVSVFLSVVPIVADPSPKYFFAIAFILSGVAVYTPFIYYKVRPTWMSKKT